MIGVSSTTTSRINDAGRARRRSSDAPRPFSVSSSLTGETEETSDVHETAPVASISLLGLQEQAGLSARERDTIAFEWGQTATQGLRSLQIAILQGGSVADVVAELDQIMVTPPMAASAALNNILTSIRVRVAVELAKSRRRSSGNQ